MDSRFPTPWQLVLQDTSAAHEAPAAGLAQIQDLMVDWQQAQTVSYADSPLGQSLAAAVFACVASALCAIAALAQMVSPFHS